MLFGLHQMRPILMSGSMIERPPKTDSPKPPETPSCKPKFGSYCIRATSELIDQTSGEPYMTFKGYDTEMHIAERVNDVCDIRLKQQKNKNFACTEPEVTMLGETKTKCDGSIFIFKNDQSWIV